MSGGETKPNVRFLRCVLKYPELKGDLGDGRANMGAGNEATGNFTSGF